MRIRCLTSKRIGTEALCIADFKMKFNPAKKQAMAGLQRGVAWHGWQVVYYTYVT